MVSTITLNTGVHVGPIDRRIFGGFLEHLGRAVYGGVYDPGNALSDQRGFRKDVLAALSKLDMPVVRYPGGNYVSAYDWRDTVGPRSERPRRPDYAWQSVETNQFGIGEFADWCDAAGTRPMLAVNLGTGTAAEAAALVEYCNLPAGTQWADARVSHGRPSPYAVELWGLGNEVDGPWQAGHAPAAQYAQRAFQASFLMKQLDPSIETVAAGSSGRGMPTYLSWDREVLETCWETVDYISAHRYSDNNRGDSAWYLAEGIEIERILDDYAGTIDYVRGLKRSDKRVYLAFDEWNVWYRARGGSDTKGAWQQAPPLLEEVYNLEDAIVCAQYLAAFVRRANLVKVACLAQIVNVIAPVMTRKEGLWLQTIYQPFVLFSKYARGVSLTPRIASPHYEAGERGSVPVLDAAAAFDPDSGQLVAFLINRGTENDLDVQLRVEDRHLSSEARVTVFGGSDVADVNTWQDPDRVTSRPGSSQLSDGVLTVTVPAPGLAVVVVGTRAR
jgi:alpha-N-arabinofuranosidase